MGNKPEFELRYNGQAGNPEGRAYFLARFLGFFCTISSRVFTGIAIIRRASSSREIGVFSFASRALFMLESHHE